VNSVELFLVHVTSLKYRMCSPGSGFFCDLRGNVLVVLATQHKFLRKFNLRLLATTCKSVWPELFVISSRFFYILICLRVTRGSYVHLTFLSLFAAPPDEKEVDGKIWIEFDDGDSGFFQLNEIKRIHPDFPVEGKRIVSSTCSATQVIQKKLRVLLLGVRPMASRKTGRMLYPWAI